MIMWDKAILGTDFYHLLLWFILYSILGWFLESVYMSICNKKLTNRGFARMPLCPIYGFGFVGAYFIFLPISGNFLLLFVSAALFATIFEFLVGELMIHFLGNLWWDYNEKPFNYKGIICLESTIGWGIYGLCLFGFLQKFIEGLSNSIDPVWGQRFCSIIMVIYMLDFFTQLARALNLSERENLITRRVKENYQKLRNRL